MMLKMLWHSACRYVVQPLFATWVCRLQHSMKPVAKLVAAASPGRVDAGYMQQRRYLLVLPKGGRLRVPLHA